MSYYNVYEDGFGEYQENRLDELLVEFDEFRQLFKLPNTQSALERWLVALSYIGDELPDPTIQSLRKHVTELGETGETFWRI